MSINKKIDKWKRLTDNITSKWIKDYFDLTSVNADWIANEGGVFECNDYYFDFSTVLKCYELGVTKEQLFSWYDHRLENESSNISLETYILNELDKINNMKTKPVSSINKKYVKLLQTIINKGFTYEDPNRKGVHRLQIPSYTLSHKFKSEGFPIITIKKSFIESACQEMKAFMLGETNLKALKNRGINFWDKDAYNKAKSMNFNNSFEDFKEYVKDYGFDLGSIYPHHIRNFNYKTDQLEELINTLKTNPFATKKTVTMWNPSDTDYCLSPCHWAFEAIVTPPKFGGKKNRLTIKWHQHSTDTFLGLPMNIMYYSFTCYLLAEICDMEAYGIIGDLSNVHLYDNSIDEAKELIKKENIFKKVNIKTNIIKSESIDDMIESFSYTIDDTENGGIVKVEMIPYKN